MATIALAPEEIAFITRMRDAARQDYQAAQDAYNVAYNAIHHLPISGDQRAAFEADMPVQSERAYLSALALDHYNGLLAAGAYEDGEE